LKRYLFFIIISSLLLQSRFGFAAGDDNQGIDCGKGGWQKMEEKCSAGITDAVVCTQCLSGFSWANVGAAINNSEIKEGYIEIGGRVVFDAPGTGRIKVFVYHQWAVDKEGNLYLRNELG
jgi:hypothetical protein